VLDVPVTRPGETSALEKECVRVPLLVMADGRPEWRQDPRWWLGLELRIDGFLQRLAGVDATVLFPITFGAFVGPLRVGLEFGWGVAGGPRDPRNPSGSAGVLEAGVRVDSPVVAIGRFATGVRVLYIVEGWNYRTNPTTTEAVSATVHGPRAALRFLLIPPPPPSSKYEARPDSWTTGLEFGVSRLYLAGDGAATTAIGGSYVGDIGW
jgi:hypothetical protein